MSAQPRVQAVVVHHRSPTTLLKTVEALLAAGISPQNLVVIDNSPPDDPDVLLAGYHVQVRRTANHGYAAAANVGIDLLAASQCAYTIVCSHEATISPDGLARLVTTLESDPLIGVAGPTLMVVGGREIWSTGGFISRRLHLARHTAEPSETLNCPVDREWLDGALTIYRTDALAQNRFDERYFLYFEETDLHLRLRRTGYRVVWEPRATAEQSSSGIPPFLLGRNTLLFQDAHFSRWSGRRAVVFEAGRLVARKALTGRGEWGGLRQIIRGWLAAERAIAGAARASEVPA